MINKEEINEINNDIDSKVYKQLEEKDNTQKVSNNINNEEEEFLPIQKIFIKSSKKEIIKDKKIENTKEENNDISNNNEESDSNLSFKLFSEQKKNSQKYINLLDLEPFFTQFNNHMEKKGEEIIKEISNDYKVEEIEQNKIIFRYGDEADKFFIINEGEVSLYFPFTEVINMNIDEYYIYILRLRRYNEIEMLNNVLLLNHGEYMVEFDEGFDMDEYVIKLYNTYLKLKFDPSFLYQDDLQKKKKIKKMKNIHNNEKKKNNFNHNIKKNKDYDYNKEFDNSKFQTFYEREIKELVLRIGDEILETMKWIMPEKIYNIIEERKENQIRKRIINIQNKSIQKYKELNPNIVCGKEYNQRILPIKIQNNRLVQKTLIVMKYLYLSTLKRGEWFGDFCPDSLSLFSPIYLGIAKASRINLKMHKFRHFRNMTAISTTLLKKKNNLDKEEDLKEEKTKDKNEIKKKEDNSDYKNEDKNKNKKVYKKDDNKDDKIEEKSNDKIDNKTEDKEDDKKNNNKFGNNYEKENKNIKIKIKNSKKCAQINDNKVHLISFNRKIFFTYFNKFIENLTFHKKNFLLNNSLFLNTDNKNLIKTYSICFKERELKEGEYIIKEHDKLYEPNINIYFIIKGEFQANCKKSISEIDQIIKQLGHEKNIQETFPKLLKGFINTPYYNVLIKKPLKLKLNYLNKHDIIGLSETIINDEYFNNVQCKSIKARVYYVDARIIKLLIDSDPIISNNKNILLYYKYEMLSDILLKQRKIYFDSVFNSEKYNVNIINKKNNDENNDREMIDDNYTNNIVQNGIAAPNLIIIPKINKIKNALEGKITQFNNTTKNQNISIIVKKINNKKTKKVHSQENILKNLGDLDTMLANLNGNFTLKDIRIERSLQFRKKYQEKMELLKKEKKKKEEEKQKKREMLSIQMQLYKQKHQKNLSFYEFKKSKTIYNKMFKVLPLLPNKDSYIKSEGEYKFIIPYKEAQLKKSNSARNINPLAYDNFNRNYNTQQYFNFNSNEKKIEEKGLDGKKDYIMHFISDIKLVKRRNNFIKNDNLTRKLRKIYKGKFDTVLFNDKKLKAIFE